MRTAVIGLFAIALTLGVWFAAQRTDSSLGANDETNSQVISSRPLVSNRNNPRSPNRRLLVGYLVEEGYSESDSERMAAMAGEGLAECEIESIRAGDPSGAWGACERTVMEETGTLEAYRRLFREYVTQVGAPR